MLTVTNVNYNAYKGFDGSGLQGQINLNGKKLCRFYDDSHGAGLQLSMTASNPTQPPQEVYQQLINAIAEANGQTITWEKGCSRPHIDWEPFISDLIEQFEKQSNEGALEKYVAKLLEQDVAKLIKKYGSTNLRGYTLTLYGRQTGNTISWNSTLAKPGQVVSLPAEVLSCVCDKRATASHVF